MPRSQGFHERAQSLAVHPWVADGDHLDRLAAQVRRRPQRLAHGEQTDRDDDDVDAVGDLRNAEGEPLLAGGLVDADQADGQAEAERRQPADPGAAEHRRHRDEGEQHDREEVGGGDLDREVRDRGREDRQQQGGDGAGDERPDGRGGQRLRGAAGLGHLVALDGRDHRRALAGGVQQDRRRRPAVHAAVVDAREHDQGAGDVQAAGERQEQGDRHGRADAGQHADRRAEEHTDDGVQQVLGRQRGPEPGDELVQRVHQRMPFRMPTGRSMPRPKKKRYQEPKDSTSAMTASRM